MKKNKCEVKTGYCFKFIISLFETYKKYLEFRFYNWKPIISNLSTLQT